MRERATQFAQFVRVGPGLRRRPGHMTIGTHQHSRGGHPTGQPSGGDAELVSDIGHRGCPRRSR